MSAAQILFDAASHTYRVNGQVRPSVTRVIQPLQDWGFVPEGVLEAAAKRGSAVHLACQLHDEDDLDEGSVTAEVRPYLDAWKRFRNDVPCTWEHIEKPMGSVALGYAGTCDRLGLLRDEHAAVEIKAVAQVVPAYGVQLAGYCGLWRPAAHRYVVQLLPTRQYRLHRFVHPDDFRVFGALLTLHHWKEKYQ